jgi:arylsulfatase A
MNRRSFLALSAAAAGTAAQRTPRRKTNVVLIFADDLGYGDLGCYGSRLNTPNLDRMAAEGVRFTDFYSGNPVCSPSRAALLTGRYPTRAGVPRVFFPRDTTGLNLDEQTLADLLKAEGYRTMCVGKWHLGHHKAYLPTSRGFDHYFGIPYSNDMDPAVLLRDEETVEPKATLETLTPRYTEEAVKFIRESADNPFFLYMPHTFPHIPLAASERFKGKTHFGIYGDVIAELDWSVGQVLDALKMSGADNDTLVIFTSDNGPWYLGSPGRLRGRKGTTSEGGMRVPFIARYPGRIPKAQVTSAHGSVLDMVPTLTRLCGAKLPRKPIDGVDLWSAMTGRTKVVEREAMLYFDGWNIQCARWKNWKLHVARYNTPPYVQAPAAGRVNLSLKNAELYDLSGDPDESYDVAGANPSVVAEIRGRIDRMLSSFPAEVQDAWRETLARPVISRAAGAHPNAGK